MPTISVVVPVYKVEPYLRRCVDSILAQTYTDFQLILVDDGSPDNCGNICDEYAEKDIRVHVIHRKNGGLSAARNSGIDWVFDGHMTEWITFIDSDDWVNSFYLELLLSANLKNCTSVSACSALLAYNESQFTKCKGINKCINPEEYWVENRGNATVAWGKLYKTAYFSEIRYPEGKLNEDEYTTFKILFQEDRVSVSSDELYMYYQASSSIMRSKWNVRKLDSLGGYAEQLIFFEDNGFKKAFKKKKKNYIFSIKYNIAEIKKSDNPQKYMNTLIEQIQSFLFQRYHSRLLSSKLFTKLYIRKLIIEQYFTIRFNAIKNRIRKKNNKNK